MLYEHDSFAGRQAHVEGGSYYDLLGTAANDQTSSIEVFAKLGATAATYYLGDYPSSRENFFSEEAQGVAHDASAWFLTTKDRVYRVPFSYDLNSKSAPNPVRIDCERPVELAVWKRAKRKAAQRRPLQSSKLSVRSGHHARRAILSTMERRVAEPRKTDKHHCPSRRLRYPARHVELEGVLGRGCGKAGK